jgi:hypothetical protein
MRPKPLIPTRTAINLPTYQIKLIVLLLGFYIKQKFKNWYSRKPESDEELIPSSKYLELTYNTLTNFLPT